MPEYSGFDYGPSQLMAVDSYGMSIPPPYASMPLPMPCVDPPVEVFRTGGMGAEGDTDVGVVQTGNPDAANRI
jgi:hypothetical protein